MGTSFLFNRPAAAGPEMYDAPGVKYLSFADQEALPYQILKVIPPNSFGRKNVGYLYAIHHGAKVRYYWATLELCKSSSLHHQVLGEEGAGSPPSRVQFNSHRGLLWPVRNVDDNRYMQPLHSVLNELFCLRLC